MLVWSFEAAVLPVWNDDGDKRWETRTLYAIFVFIGVIYVLAFAANRLILEKLGMGKERRVVTAFLLMVVGCLFLTPFGANDDLDVPKWQVIVACPFLTTGFAICTIQLPAMYCKLVGAKVFFCFFSFFFSFFCI